MDEPRLAGLMLKEAWRRLRRRLRGLPSGALRVLDRAPPRLVLAPPSLARGDPAFVERVYFGRFALAGHVATLGARSPFTVRDAPRAWTEDLHGFEWLRHFTEAGDAFSRASARALLDEWLRLSRRQMPAAGFGPDVSARRIIAWLTHSGTVLADADAGFARRFLQRLAGDVRDLRCAAPHAPAGLPRLRVRLALALAALCLPAAGCGLKVALANLADELDRQVFADGGHVSRNPAAIVAILADLLPLRAILAAEGHALPRGIIGAVDRMLPTLRFLSHADGALALVNGCGATDAPLLAAILAHDETLGEPISHLRQSGYQRLAQNGTVVIADTGLPPAPSLSGAAHAGTLGFEFSAGGRRIVVHCGAPAGADEASRRLARSTAAHSTLTLADRSSARLSRAGRLDRFLGGPLVAGPTRVPVVREDDEAGQRLVAAHDGYRAAFGLVHERSLFLARNGRVIAGTDRLLDAPLRAARPADMRQGAAAVRFHLHPDVRAERAGSGIRLFARGDVWWFFADAPATVEESIFFADSAGARRTFQILVSFECLGRTEVSWRFERHS